MSSDSLSIIHANFAIKSINKLIENNNADSIIYSPVSLGIALAMAYAGSSGETKKIIKKHLVGDENDDEVVHQHFNEFLNNITKNEEFSLECVNKIYVKDGFSLLQTYTQTIMKYYKGQFEQIDFTNSDSSLKINNFVKQATNNIIDNLIQQSDLDELTRLILINAIYFKGKWFIRFNKNETTTDDFYITNDETKKVEMMSKRDKYGYYEDDDYQILQLEYEGKQNRMVILLPKEKCSLKDKLPNLDGQLLFDLMDSTDTVPVKVYLPKFKTESTHDLKDTLIQLGIDIPFTDDADFSLITNEEPLKISKVVQKAFVEADEEGVEAAAATAMIMACRSAMMHRPTPEYIFKADHPFIYFITDNQRNILFTGIYQ